VGKMRGSLRQTESELGRAQMTKLLESRWFYFAVANAVATGALVGWSGVHATPLGAFACDPQDIAGSQLRDVGTFGDWIAGHLLVVFAATIGLAFASYYFQLFHVKSPRSGWLFRIAMVLALSAFASYWVIDVARDWSRRQADTCLGQGLADPVIAAHVRFQPALLPHLVWDRGLALDSVLSIAIAVLLGIGSYALLRRLSHI